MPTERTIRLTERERRFCEALLSGAANNVEACRRAGYTGRDLAGRAQEILARPRVQAHLEELRAAAKSSAVAALQERLETLTSIGRGEPVTHVLKDGSTVQAPAAARDRIQAIHEIGKLLGDYTKKVEVTGTMTLVDLIDELDATAGALGAATTH